MPTKILKSIYQSLFESHLHFGSIVWGSAKQTILSKLEIQQKKAIRHINNLKYNSHTAESFQNLQYLKLYDLIKFNQAIFIRNYKNNKLPYSFNNMLSDVPDNTRRSRDDDYNYSLPQSNYACLLHYPTPKLVYNWNCLPLTLKSVSEHGKFRRELKLSFLSKYETLCTKSTCRSCQG